MLLFSLPIIFSFLLFGYIWYNSKEKNVLAIILVLASIATPLLPILYYPETMLLISTGMFGGWLISLFTSPQIKKNKTALLIKGFVSLSFLLGFTVNFFAFSIDFVIWQNYYNEIIIEVGQGFITALFIIIGIRRVRKNKQLISELINNR